MYVGSLVITLPLSLLVLQLAERWQVEDALITFGPDRVDADLEDPDTAAYTPRIDLEETQAARASKASSLDPIRDWPDDDDCYILDPIVARPLPHALPTGGSAGGAARAGTRQNVPLATGKRTKKAAQKGKKNAPPAMPPRASLGPRVMPTESG